MAAIPEAIIITLKPTEKGVEAAFAVPNGPFSIGDKLYRPADKCHFRPDGVDDDGRVLYACSACGGQVTLGGGKLTYCPNCGAFNESEWI